MTAFTPSVPRASRRTLAQRDRRSFKRVSLRLTGRFLDAQSEDRDFLTSNVSCDGALIIANERPAANEQVVCYFDELGRVTATIIRHAPGGFAVRFQISGHKRDKLADRLTWLLNKDVLGLSDEREAERFSAGGPALVTLPDGHAIQCRVIDISLTGAGFEALGPAPFEGDVVLVGTLRAQVVRVAARNFAVRFLRGTAQPE